MASHNLGLALNHIKRMTVGFSQPRDEKHHEDREQRQPVPRKKIESHARCHALALTHDDVRHIQTGGDHEHNHQAKTDGDFIAHHLSGRAHGAQESVFGVGGPASDDDAVNL